MIGGKIDFDRIRWDLSNIDIRDNHRYNYLRDRILEQRKRQEDRANSERI